MRHSYEERGKQSHEYRGPKHCYPCDQIARYRAMFGTIDEEFVEWDQELEPQMRVRSVLDLNRVVLTEGYQLYLRSDERFAMWQAEARGQSAPHTQQEVS